MATKKGAEVAQVVTAAEVEAVRQEKLREIASQAIAEMKEAGADFDEEQMMFDILEAQSFEDILGESVIHLKDIIGVPITVHSCTLQESKFEGGFLPAYAVMRVEFDDGARAVVTTGAAQVVASMVKAHAAGWFPVRFSTTMITTGNGFDVIKMAKAPDKNF